MRTVLSALLLLVALTQEKKYRLPSTDLKQQVISGEMKPWSGRSHAPFW